MYSLRRQNGLKVYGKNINFLKKKGNSLDIPEKYQTQLPNHGIRIGLHYATGYYKGMMQPMVSLYLFDKRTGDKGLLETLILTNNSSIGRGNQLEPLLNESYSHNYTKELKLIITDYCIDFILKDYFAEKNK